MPESETIEFLSRRRSSKLIHLDAPGPDLDQLNRILRVGTRVPDHGKLAPWCINVFQGDARARFGQHIAERYRALHPDSAPDEHTKERERFLRAPLVLGVVSCPVIPHKIPVWEQHLSAGALCYNLCLAANALGFGTNWITEWIAQDPVLCEYLGCGPDDRVAGFIYIGTPTQTQDDRERPDLARCVTVWK